MILHICFRIRPRFYEDFFGYRGSFDRVGNKLHYEPVNSRDDFLSNFVTKKYTKVKSPESKFDVIDLHTGDNVLKPHIQRYIQNLKTIQNLQKIKIILLGHGAPNHAVFSSDSGAKISAEELGRICSFIRKSVSNSIPIKVNLFNCSSATGDTNSFDVINSILQKGLSCNIHVKGYLTIVSTKLNKLKLSGLLQNSFYSNFNKTCEHSVTAYHDNGKITYDVSAYTGHNAAKHKKPLMNEYNQFKTLYNKGYLLAYEHDFENSKNNSIALEIIYYALNFLLETSANNFHEGLYSYNKTFNELKDEYNKLQTNVCFKPLIQWLLSIYLFAKESFDRKIIEDHLKNKNCTEDYIDTNIQKFEDNIENMGKLLHKLTNYVGDLPTSKSIRSLFDI
ncbi:hypothetical protein IB643_03290 [Allofrancisella guangzhouensis]|uniref:hypothetical protein n=1 Tax=Allofrancisella guangzhouensis TaxID=594679 RepID=UPI001906DB6D|nr:hypothetical protein [Allofrancisella guangzhouensis]MBK2027180.1 hypothetical protein [Allofrancisella guangzhouensis]